MNIIWYFNNQNSKNKKVETDYAAKWFVSWLFNLMKSCLMNPHFSHGIFKSKFLTSSLRGTQITFIPSHWTLCTVTILVTISEKKLRFLSLVWFGTVGFCKGVQNEKLMNLVERRKAIQLKLEDNWLQLIFAWLNREPPISQKEMIQQNLFQTLCEYCKIYIYG